jgi:3-oxoadipate enol-lactonase
MEGGIELNPDQFQAANKALERFDFRPNLDKITAKTLVMSGKYDGLNPVEFGRENASYIQNVTFIEFE